MLVRNVLLALGVLALVAGIALSGIWFIRSGQNTVSEVKAPPPVVQSSILVAARAIRAGTLLRGEDITWRDARPADIRPGSLVRGQALESEFLGSVARRDFVANDPIIASDFVKPSERGFLAAVLKPGARAVSIVVDASQSSSGLILPGDHIDVILIQSFGDTVQPSRKEVAETVLTDVRVIAVDQSLNTEAKTAQTERRVGVLESHLPKTLSLEVNPQEAERLLVASQLGRLGVSVRALVGSEIPATSLTGRSGPTWASDVSTALSQLGGRQQREFTTGSTIEKSIRRVPPRGTTIVAPVEAEQATVTPSASNVNGSVPVAVPGDSQ